jgi:acyl-coenzyme A synthetase/AMP-(fatty) acid ligase
VAGNRPSASFILGRRHVLAAHLAGARHAQHRPQPASQRPPVPDKRPCAPGAHAELRRTARASWRLAHALADLGIRRGDKVALACPNVLEFPLAYYAVLKLGAVAVPLNVMLKAPSSPTTCADSDAKAFLCHEGHADLPMAQEGWRAFEQVRAEGGACAHFILIGADPAAADRRRHAHDRRADGAAARTGRHRRHPPPTTPR